jgi:hypothetical protein
VHPAVVPLTRRADRQPPVRERRQRPAQARPHGRTPQRGVCLRRQDIRRPEQIAAREQQHGALHRSGLRALRASDHQVGRPVGVPVHPDRRGHGLVRRGRVAQVDRQRLGDRSCGRRAAEQVQAGRVAHPRGVRARCSQQARADHLPHRRARGRRLQEHAVRGADRLDERPARRRERGRHVDQPPAGRRPDQQGVGAAAEGVPGRREAAPQPRASRPLQHEVGLRGVCVQGRNRAGGHGRNEPQPAQEDVHRSSASQIPGGAHGEIA